MSGSRIQSNTCSPSPLEGSFTLRWCVACAVQTRPAQIPASLCAGGHHPRPSPQHIIAAHCRASDWHLHRPCAERFHSVLRVICLSSCYHIERATASNPQQESSSNYVKMHANFAWRPFLYSPQKQDTQTSLLLCHARANKLAVVGASQTFTQERKGQSRTEHERHHNANHRNCGNLSFLS